MRIRQAALVLALTGLAASEIAVAQQAVIRPSPEAPVQPRPRSQAEQDSYFTVQNASTAINRLRAANDFFADYFDSEYRHLVLYQEWLARGELQHDAEDILDVVLRAIEAQDHFLTSKLNFIDDPSSVEDLPAVRFTLANREALFYQSIVAAYRAEGDNDRVEEYGELALNAQAEALELLRAVGDDGTPEYQQAVQQSQEGRLFVLHTLLEGTQEEDNFDQVVEYGEEILEITPDDLFVLHTLRVGYEDAGDLEKLVEYGEAILAVTPDDLDVLRATALIMSEQPGSDLESAKAYATDAVQQMIVFLDGPDGNQFNDDEKAGLLSEVNTTLGMIHFQLEEWTGAADAFRAALGAMPTDPFLYYTLALASNANRDLEGTLSALARAVYLEHPEPQVLAALTAMFESVNGSTDGLEDFIESEGAQIED